VKILFFGSGNCEYSRRAHEYLNQYSTQITTAWSQHRRDHRVPAELCTWQGDLIISYRTAFIVPEKILKKAQMAAINFHPASPEYPGSGSYSWALYEMANHFGSTAHIMTEKIDAGPILITQTWPISEQDTVQTLFIRAQQNLFELFKQFIQNLFAGGAEFVQQQQKENHHLSWRGPARRIEDLDTLMNIPINADETEMARRIRATHYESFRPFVVINGRKFSYEA
jgi:methionyl-tRNA formyltransferase